MRLFWGTGEYAATATADAAHLAGHCGNAQHLDMSAYVFAFEKVQQGRIFFSILLTTLLHISHRIKSDTSTHQISHNEPIYSVRKFILYIINIIIVRE